MFGTPSSKLSIFEAGSAGNPPTLVILPGFLCSAQQLLKPLLPLAESTRLVAVEWRGCGKSEVSRSCKIKDLASDVMSVIRSQIEGSKICILAHSLGARVFWSMLESFESELSSVLQGAALIDQNPSAVTSPAGSDYAHSVFKLNNQLIASGKQQMMKMMQTMWGETDKGFMHSNSAISEWMAFAADCNPATAASIHWDALTQDYSNIVQTCNIKVPTLLMIGDATIEKSEAPQRMTKAVPPHGAHFAMFRGGTHCFFQQPEQVPKLLSLMKQLLQGSLENNAFPEARQRQREAPHIQRACHRIQRSPGASTRTAARLPCGIRGGYAPLHHGPHLSRSLSAQLLVSAR